MGEPCLSEYRLDRHLLALETEEEYISSLAHIRSCSRCEQDVKSWREAALVPVSIPVESISTKARWLQWWSGFGTRSMVTWATAACSFAILWLVVRPSWMETQTTTPNARKSLLQPQEAPTKRQTIPSQRTKQLLPLPKKWLVKGDSTPLLLVERVRKGHSQQVTTGALFKKGDEIWISFRWLAGGYVWLVHRDQKGAFSALLPERKDAKSTSIHQGGIQKLPDSFEVSGQAHKNEVIWACFSPRPVLFREVQAAISKQMAPSLPKKPNAKSVCRWLLPFVMRRVRP